MAKRFECLEVGDQLELPVGKELYVNDKLDPDMTCGVAVVTHIWTDPVERKEFVAYALLNADGTFDQPKAKYTRTGLARRGWRKAKLDWIARFKNISNSESVVSISRRGNR